MPCLILLFYLLLINTSSFAQKDTCIPVIEVDKFTNRKSAGAGYVQLDQGDDGLLIDFDRHSKYWFLSLSIMSKETFCTGPSCTIILLYKDKTKSIIRVSPEIRCNGIVIATIYNSNVLVFKALKLKLISAIRIEGMDGSKDYDLTEAAAAEVKSIVNCLSTAKL